MLEWEELQNLLGDIQLNIERDYMIWKLTKTGVYKAKSLYQAISFGGVKDCIMQDLWRSPIPLKIKIFFWLMLRGKIQVVSQLEKMKWADSRSCKSNPILLSFFAADSWAIWLMRNDWMFSNKLVSDASHLPYKAVSCLLQWRKLAPTKERSTLDASSDLLLANIRRMAGSNVSSIPL